MDIKTFEKDIEGLGINTLEQLIAAATAEIQFRLVCDNVYEQDLFMGNVTEDEIRAGW